MHPEVSRAFGAFSERFEGRVDYFYLDILGLVTVGVGNLVDPIGEALRLAGAPWFFPDQPNRVVTPDDLGTDWHAVKARQDLARAGHRAFATIARLRLASAGIDELVARKARAVEETLKHGTPAFGTFDSWPADAQLGLLSMAWAMGPGFARESRWPAFRAACTARDWRDAALQCRMRDAGNPGLRSRNDANVRLFTMAAAVEAQGGPWDRLTPETFARTGALGAPRRGPVSRPAPAAARVSGRRRPAAAVARRRARRRGDGGDVGRSGTTA